MDCDWGSTNLTPTPVFKGQINCGELSLKAVVYTSLGLEARHGNAACCSRNGACCAKSVEAVLWCDLRHPFRVPLSLILNLPRDSLPSAFLVT